MSPAWPMGHSALTTNFCTSTFYIFSYKKLLCDIPTKSYEMLNIAMYNIIQNNFTEIWAVVDCQQFMCTSLGHRSCTKCSITLSFHIFIEKMFVMMLLGMINILEKYGKSEKCWSWLIFWSITQNQVYCKEPHLVMLGHKWLHSLIVPTTIIIRCTQITYTLLHKNNNTQQRKIHIQNMQRY